MTTPTASKRQPEYLFRLIVEQAERVMTDRIEEIKARLLARNNSKYEFAQMEAHAPEDIDYLLQLVEEQAVQIATMTYPTSDSADRCAGWRVRAGLDD